MIRLKGHIGRDQRERVGVVHRPVRDDRLNQRREPQLPRFQHIEQEAGGVLGLAARVLEAPEGIERVFL